MLLPKLAYLLFSPLIVVGLPIPVAVGLDKSPADGLARLSRRSGRVNVFDYEERPSGRNTATNPFTYQVPSSAPGSRRNSGSGRNTPVNAIDYLQPQGPASWNAAQGIWDDPPPAYSERQPSAASPPRLPSPESAPVLPFEFTLQYKNTRNRFKDMNGGTSMGVKDVENAFKARFKVNKVRLYILRNGIKTYLDNKNLGIMAGYGIRSGETIYGEKTK